MYRFLDHFKIQPDSTRLNITSAPLGFHLFHPPLGHLHTNNRFPFSNQRSNLFLELSAIPGDQYTFPFTGTATGSHVKIHCLVIAKHYRWRALLINHIEQVTVTLIVVALTANKFSCRLALLSFKLSLLTLDPCQLRNNKEAYSLIIYAQWCRHSYPTVWWINTKMKV